MPTTAENITQIKRDNGSYSREECLSSLDELVEIVYEENMDQVLAIDENTGMPPFLATQDEVRAYDCPADCRVTVAIFIETPINDYSIVQNKAFYTEYNFRSVQYLRVAATSRNATPGQVATVTFVDNPGATTGKYYHQYYLKHVPITDESIQIPLPGNTHWLLRKGVQAMLSSENYGDMKSQIDAIQFIAKKVRDKLNRGTQARVYRTEWQPEYRDGEHYEGIYL